MKLLCALLVGLSFNVMAQRTEKIIVPSGDMETTISRKSAETRKQTAQFSWQETVRGTEQVCVATSVRYRPIYCRDRRGRVRICGRRAYTTCIRYETREYTRVINHRYGVKLKFDKSARTGYRGIEQYLVTFDKASRCGFVTAANTNAERRMIDNKSCRKAIIK